MNNPPNALEDTGVYGLPDAVLVPSIGVDHYKKRENIHSTPR